MTGSPLLTGLTGGYAIATDAAGNVWSQEGSGLVKLSNSGSVLSGPGGYTGGGLNYPQALAVDGAGNVWAANIVANDMSPDGNLSEVSNAGVPISGATGYIGQSFNGEAGALYYPIDLAIDGSGDVWVTNSYLNYSSANSRVTEFIGVAVPVITPIAAGLPATPTANGSSNLGTRP